MLCNLCINGNLLCLSPQNLIKSIFSALRRIKSQRDRKSSTLSLDLTYLCVVQVSIIASDIIYYVYMRLDYSTKTLAAGLRKHRLSWKFYRKKLYHSIIDILSSTKIWTITSFLRMSHLFDALKGYPKEGPEVLQVDATSKK